MDCSSHQVDVALFDTREFVHAVDQNNAVVFGKRKRVLDAGIPGADHDNHFAVVFVRIIELVLHALKVFAGHTKLADIALQADAQYHVFRVVGIPCGRLDLESAFGAGD